MKRDSGSEKVKDSLIVGTAKDVVRPVRGVTPEVLWLEGRICELTRALHDSAHCGDWAHVNDWAKELRRHVLNRDRLAAGLDVLGVNHGDYE
jgi:hypothetical protein